MIDLKKEILKYKPVMEVEDVEGSISSDEIQDMMDILKQLGWIYDNPCDYNFYNENKVLVDDEKVKNGRIYLTYAVGNVLKIGAKLLGMNMPEKM